MFVGIFGFVLGWIGVVWALLAIGGVLLFFPLNRMQTVFFAAAVLVVFLVALGSWFSFRYGRRIGVFLKTQDLHDLERALSSQRTFWRLAGIAIAAAVAIGLVLALMVG
jgi:hypothetical protein